MRPARVGVVTPNIFQPRRIHPKISGLYRVGGKFGRRYWKNASNGKIDAARFQFIDDGRCEKVPAGFAGANKIKDTGVLGKKRLWI